MRSKMKILLLLTVVFAFLELRVKCAKALSMFTPSGYIGCFFSYPGFLNSIHYKRLSASFNNTGTECKDRCKAEGFRYAGTVASINCFCGNGIHSLKPATNCNETCPGNLKEYCGGSWDMSLYRLWQSAANKWVTSGAGRPVYFIRNAKMDHGSCNAFCNLLTPKSQVAVLDKDAELWLENNKLTEASENYWINKTGQLQNECYYITGANKQRETHCHGYQRSCREATFTSRVRKASSCSLKYRCICQRRV
ncbi:uncharacterized protein LOC132757379 isoform X2 [Ruditapes philippinarum]|uniref:uncharacterized protein LOC132757379 isoform X2 n=1 Tax=Ruditapes philippinarum TaxID=129788 RepID=UPI00295B17B8|nr:uncharacterized protein LOC132757379 isoform X2 [Ruditapes philippinarum]